MAFFKKKEYKKAEIILIELLERYPSDYYVKTLLADSFRKQKRIAEDLVLTDEVLAEENNSEALAVKGLALVDSKKPQEGSEHLELSLSMK